MGRRAVILHHKLPPDAPPDDLDVLDQAEAVSEALRELGYESAVLPFDLDMESFAAKLGKLEPLFVFNLVESLDGDARLIHLACSILDHLAVPYTGAHTEAMFITSNKVLAKKWMVHAGIPTPEWLVSGQAPEGELTFPGTYIVKALCEDASVGIDALSLKEAASMDGLIAGLEERSRAIGKQCFAERYIDGREFNLSVVGGREGPRVLPPAEMTFSFPDDRPRIMDYKAKWEEGSVEYEGTKRTFMFGDQDAALLEELRRISLSCWHAFELRGYARVDFRVDGQGKPWVLEINANPCISPGSGIASAAERAGLSYAELVEHIVVDALEKGLQ